jgi:hypothetical protein
LFLGLKSMLDIKIDLSHEKKKKPFSISAESSWGG